MLTVEQRVQRGVAFMDLFAPDGWREEIDADNLHMHDANGCVIGQVFGDYFDFADEYDFTNSMMADYGFNSSRKLDENILDYAALEDEWKRVLS